MSAKLKAFLFVTILGIVAGLVVYKNFDLKLLPLVLFYIVLMIDSYFSVDFFLKIIPKGRLDQKIMDLLLFFIYLNLALNFGNDFWFLLSATMLFIVAMFKYIFLLGAVDIKVLKKKMLIDILAAIVCLLTLVAYLINGGMIVMWIWASVFLLANIYLLVIKPVYRLDN